MSAHRGGLRAEVYGQDPRDLKSQVGALPGGPPPAHSPPPVARRPQAAGRPAQVQVILDGTDPNRSNVAAGAVTRYFGEDALRRAAERARRIIKSAAKYGMDRPTEDALTLAVQASAHVAEATARTAARDALAATGGPDARL